MLSDSQKAQDVPLLQQTSLPELPEDLDRGEQALVPALQEAPSAGQFR